MKIYLAVTVLTYQEATAMIADQEIYLVSCQVLKGLVLSIFLLS